MGSRRESEKLTERFVNDLDRFCSANEHGSSGFLRIVRVETQVSTFAINCLIIEIVFTKRVVAL